MGQKDYRRFYIVCEITGCNRNATRLHRTAMSVEPVCEHHSFSGDKKIDLKGFSNLYSGTYDAGTIVAIEAGQAPAGQVFDAWTGDVSEIADLNSANRYPGFQENAILPRNLQKRLF